MVKVIIFGSSGFIGTHFRQFLGQFEGVNVFSFDINPTAEITNLDIRKTIKIEGEFSHDDLIINLAAVHRTPGHSDYEYFETNILGAQNVCEFARRIGIKNIIFASSIAPYGASEEEKQEDSLPMPNTPYGISKLNAEYIHKEWAAGDPERRLMILRPGVVFGKGENGNFTRLAAAISKGIFFFPGRKDTIKGCIYVKELVYQSWELFEKQQTQVEMYNFAYFPSYTIEEISDSVAKVLGKRKPKILIPAWLLKSAASIFKILGLSKLGIHPDRIKKLMISTNISGKKLRESIPNYKYSFEEALADWYVDCDRKGLY